MNVWLMEAYSGGSGSNVPLSSLQAYDSGRDAWKDALECRVQSADLQMAIAERLRSDLQVSRRKASRRMSCPAGAPVAVSLRGVVTYCISKWSLPTA